MKRDQMHGTNLENVAIAYEENLLAIRPFLLEENTSAIACMFSAGLLDVKTFTGTANGEFLQFCAVTPIATSNAI